MELHTYLVTDTALCGARGVADTVRLAVQGGVGVVQVRDAGATARELVHLTRTVLEVVADSGVRVLVNDRADVALAARAHGVHVGQSDLHPTDARRLLGRDAVVGLSVSTVDQVQEALRLPPACVDYLGVGPVFATATKPEAAAPLGLDGAARLVGVAGELPCVAIGGIGADNVAEVRRTGVRGVAVVSSVCAAEDPQTASSALRGAGG